MKEVRKLDKNKKSEPIKDRDAIATQAVPLWMICLICASFSLLSAVATYYFVASSMTTKKMAVVDMSLLMKTKLSQLQQSAADMKTIEADAAAFSQSLKSQFSQYNLAGVLLINSQAVLNQPAGLEDATTVIAKNIGLQLPSNK